MIIIITSNSLMRDGEYVKAYHEIHEINHLSNVSHIIASVESVIHNNLKFKNDDTVLSDVFISCSNEDYQREVLKHFSLNPINGIRFEDI